MFIQECSRSGYLSFRKRIILSPFFSVSAGCNAAHLHQLPKPDVFWSFFEVPPWFLLPGVVVLISFVSFFKIIYYLRWCALHRKRRLHNASWLHLSDFNHYTHAVCHRKVCNFATYTFVGVRMFIKIQRIENRKETLLQQNLEWRKSGKGRSVNKYP